MIRGIFAKFKVTEIKIIKNFSANINQSHLILIITKKPG